MISFGKKAVLLAAVLSLLFTVQVKAAEEETEPDSPVIVEKIDYEELEMVIDPNGNQVVYFSDKYRSTWDTVYEKDDEGNFVLDISWISPTSGGLVYLKGDVDASEVKVTVPKQAAAVKATFSKSEGTITFKNLDSEITAFEWRKTSSYQWSDPVDVADASNSSSAFCADLEKLRAKGASIRIRFPQTVGTATGGALEVGGWQGKEIAVSITKRGSAPKIKINGSKMYLNSSTSMEYSQDGGTVWKPAEKNMELEDLAPGAFGENAASQTLLFRYAEKSGKTPYSKTACVSVPAQRRAPVQGLDFRDEGTTDKKFGLVFPSASKTNPFEYVVVKPGYAFDAQSARWKSVTGTRVLYFSKTTAPEGSQIYVRKKTTAATNSTVFELASEESQLTVQYLK